MYQTKRINDHLVEVPIQRGMRVPGRIYADERLLNTSKADEAVAQVANVAHLPGIVGYSLAMPDFHWGYGFPIGGVAAFDVNDGVISPGGVGYDINCGVRILATSIERKRLERSLIPTLDKLFEAVPAGVGSRGALARPSPQEQEAVLTEGAKWAVRQGFGRKDDLDHIEDGGTYPGADPSVVSDHARKRGMAQLGTLGSGNHFLEIDVVEEVFDKEAADFFGLEEGSIAISLHTGSRGFGHQVCDDFLKTIGRAMNTHGIEVPDRQLACAPIQSEEGKAYRNAMACAANFAWANRQVITGRVREALAEAMGVGEDHLGLRLVYDVCHNIAKFETHLVDGVEREVCVHRKGATRAFAPGHPVIPKAYRHLGQPVFIPGDMGRASYLLIGAEGAMRETFGSSCHGAGRAHGRKAMHGKLGKTNPFKTMENQYRVAVRAHGRATVIEEMPEAYKNVTDVVNTVEAAGISRKVCRFRPIAVVKG